MLNVIMLNVIMLNVIMLNVIMLYVIMLNVIMLIAVMLNVVASTGIDILLIASFGQVSIPPNRVSPLSIEGVTNHINFIKKVFCTTSGARLTTFFYLCNLIIGPLD
jgi:hypothetical protein